MARRNPEREYREVDTGPSKHELTRAPPAGVRWTTTGRPTPPGRHPRWARCSRTPPCAPPAPARTARPADRPRDPCAENRPHADGTAAALPGPLPPDDVQLPVARRRHLGLRRLRTLRIPPPGRVHQDSPRRGRGDRRGHRPPLHLPGRLNGNLPTTTRWRGATVNGVIRGDPVRHRTDGWTGMSPRPRASSPTTPGSAGTAPATPTRRWSCWRTWRPRNERAPFPSPTGEGTVADRPDGYRQGTCWVCDRDTLVCVGSSLQAPGEDHGTSHSICDDCIDRTRRPRRPRRLAEVRAGLDKRTA